MDAWAGRPLTTEDADVLEADECEWESFSAHTHATGARTFRDLNTQIGCGVGGQTQLALAIDRNDLGNSATLSGKTRLLAREAQTTGLTLAWGADWLKTATGRSAHESTYLILVATRPLKEDWLVHGNLGWSRSERAAQDTTQWNLALEKSLHQGLDVMGELYGDDRQRPWLGAGWRWTPRSDLSLNASYAVQAETPRQRLLTFGFKWAF